MWKQLELEVTFSFTICVADFGEEEIKSTLNLHFDLTGTRIASYYIIQPAFLKSSLSGYVSVLKYIQINMLIEFCKVKHIK